MVIKYVIDKNSCRRAGEMLVTVYHLGKFGEQVIDGGGEVKKAVTVPGQAGPGRTQAVNI